MLLLLWACSGTPSPPSPEVPVVEPVVAPAPAPEPIHISLPFGKARPVPELGGTVTLTAGSRDTIRGEDGRLRHDVTVGTIVFAAEGAEDAAVEFVSGQAFSHAGRDMAVYGDMSLELVIAPPGQAPRP